MALTTPVGPVPTLPDSTAAEHQLATMLALFPQDELVTFVIELTRASPACEHEIWARVHNVRLAVFQIFFSMSVFELFFFLFRFFFCLQLVCLNVMCDLLLVSLSY